MWARVQDIVGSSHAYLPIRMLLDLFAFNDSETRDSQDPSLTTDPAPRPKSSLTKVMLWVDWAEKLEGGRNYEYLYGETDLLMQVLAEYPVQLDSTKPPVLLYREVFYSWKKKEICQHYNY